MRFKEYSRINNCNLISKTEQSEVFLVNKTKRNSICKRFYSKIDKCKEELAYHFIKEKGFIHIPKITFCGEDFIEMEKIKKLKEPLLRESIKNIKEMYFKTFEDNYAENIFPTLDLSKEKLFHRLSYLPRELEKVEINETININDLEKFIDKNYNPSSHRCLIHGDLKSVHIIPSFKDKIYFIDLGLMSIGSPWYDLAFLYMESSKNSRFSELLKNSYSELRNIFKINREETKIYLRSAIFYRCLYNLLFALRHRPKKSQLRTIKELEKIICK